MKVKHYTFSSNYNSGGVVRSLFLSFSLSLSLSLSLSQGKKHQEILPFLDCLSIYFCFLVFFFLMYSFISFRLQSGHCLSLVSFIFPCSSYFFTFYSPSFYSYLSSPLPSLVTFHFLPSMNSLLLSPFLFISLPLLLSIRIHSPFSILS